MVDRGRGRRCRGWFRAAVDVMQRMAGRILILLLLAALAGCFSTPVPHRASGAHSHHGQAHHGSRHHSTHKQTRRIYHSKKTVIRYVRPNDTLYSIGKQFGIDYRVIARRNHLKYPYRIYVGQRLYINRQAPRSYDPAAVKIRRISKPHRAVVKRSRNHAGSVRKKAVRAPHKVRARGYKGRLLWPVKGTVTSKFGRRGSRMHDGIDIGANEGTPVHAAASGEVVYADSRLNGYGKLVIIRHGRNLFTAYGHNQRMLVRKGARVRAGEVIARVGHTGRASGPHLHFEVRQGSTPVNPLAYLPH